MNATDEADRAEWPPHLDAVIAAPKNHRVLLEDETVRVLEVTVQPGEREQVHHHRWPSIMVILARPRYVNFDRNGEEIAPAVALPAGSALPLAVRLPPQRAHFVEVAADETHALRAVRFELKARLP